MLEKKCSAYVLVQNMFGHISRELDMRHDKRERIVKISRDITIGVCLRQYQIILLLSFTESKRIIFALHRIKTDEDKASVLAEAARRFTELRWRDIVLFIGI